MDVDDPPLEAGQQRRGDEAHEAGQHHQRWVALGDLVRERFVPGLAALVVPRGDDAALDPTRGGDVARAGLRAVGDERHHTRLATPLVDGIQERGEVRSSAGSQDDDVEGAHET